MVVAVAISGVVAVTVEGYHLEFEGFDQAGCANSVARDACVMSRAPSHHLETPHLSVSSPQPPAPRRLVLPRICLGASAGTATRRHALPQSPLSNP